MNITFWDAFQQLTLTGQILFFAALAVAFAFEFINGFHDTANAVTTVIYMRTEHLSPDEVLLAAKVEFDRDLDMTELSAAIDSVEAAVRTAYPRAKFIFIEPDIARA